MTRRRTVSPHAASLALVLVMMAGSASAQDTPRLSDDELKGLIEDVDHSRDRFEDALDGGFKHSIVRGPRGEVQVKQYLDDLQENTGRLKDRYNSGYSASAEARTVLQQGSDIERYMSGQPDSMRGRSEWDRLARSLGTLAHAYATTFPLPPEASVRRINDKEAGAAAEAAVKAADQFKKSAGKDTTLPKDQRQSLKDRADAFARLSKDVRSRLNDHKPGTAEARQMFDAFGQLTSAAAAASPSTQSALGPLRAAMETLRQAFGLTPPPAMR
jgi:hypothetical protein